MHHWVFVPYVDWFSFVPCVSLFFIHHTFERPHSHGLNPNHWVRPWGVWQQKCGISRSYLYHTFGYLYHTFGQVKVAPWNFHSFNVASHIYTLFYTCVVRIFPTTYCQVFHIKVIMSIFNWLSNFQTTSHHPFHSQIHPMPPQVQCYQKPLVLINLKFWNTWRCF